MTTEQIKAVFKARGFQSLGDPHPYFPNSPQSFARDSVATEPWICFRLEIVRILSGKIWITTTTGESLTGAITSRGIREHQFDTIGELDALIATLEAQIKNHDLEHAPEFQ